MNSPEVFYLHLEGSQRGPYTIRHIDHLLNSGLINEDVLYWREGLEQWQPVTQLVVRRAEKERWKMPALGLSIALLLGLLLYVFGPITFDGWREIYQHKYTREAAYWRARDAVRTQAVPKGALVVFEPFRKKEVQLSKADRGVAILRAALTDNSGATRKAAWEVPLKYDPAKREWSCVDSPQPIAP